MKRFFTIIVTVSILLSACTLIKVDVDLSSLEKLLEEQETKGKTLVISSQLWSPEEQEFLLSKIVDPFKEEYECKVNLNFVDDNEQLLEQVKVQKDTDNVTTDVVVVDGSWMSNWVEAELISDLSVDVFLWLDRSFPEGITRLMIFDDKQYFVPIGADVDLLVVNKKALAYLPKGANVQDMSWKQLVDWSLAIARGEGKGKYAVPGTPQHRLTEQIGGTILSYGGGFPDINSPEALEAWKLLVKMQNAYTPQVLTYENVIEAMKKEETWLAVVRSSHAGEIMFSSPIQFVIAPAPKGPAGIGSIVNASGFAIPEGAPNKTLALKFLEYMTRPDVQLQIAKGIGGFVPSVNEVEKLLKEGIEDEVIKRALPVMDRGVLATIPPSFGEHWEAVQLVYDSAFKKLVLEDGEIDEMYLDLAQQEIESWEIK